jgi:hypothetical protein
MQVVRAAAVPAAIDRDMPLRRQVAQRERHGFLVDSKQLANAPLTDLRNCPLVHSAGQNGINAPARQ